MRRKPEQLMQGLLKCDGDGMEDFKSNIAVTAFETADVRVVFACVLGELLQSPAARFPEFPDSRSDFLLNAELGHLPKKAAAISLMSPETMSLNSICKRTFHMFRMMASATTANRARSFRSAFPTMAAAKAGRDAGLLYFRNGLVVEIPLQRARGDYGIAGVASR